MTLVSPVTGIALDPVLMFLTGLSGGFVSGFLGLGCGVVITPILMEFGIPPLIAISTQLCHAVGTNLTSFLTYKRKLDVDYHLAAYMLLGGLLGTISEWFILHYFHDAKLVVKKFAYLYAFVLVIFGFVMLIQSFKELKAGGSPKYKKSVSMRRWMVYLPFHRIFVRSRTEMSVIIPIFVGFLAGVLVSSLGGGNNLFMAPMITYLIGRISPVVNGTTALVGCIITAAIALIYSMNNYCCDMLIVLLLFSGAVLGCWIGVRLTYSVRRCYIYAAGAIVVFLMASRQIFKLLHHSFVKNVDVKVNLSNSSLSWLTDTDPVKYTLTCLLIIAAVAIVYEFGLQRLYEERKVRLKRRNAR
ncbi:MAG: sulfite exporter TauE/SafE family protein [Alphaproteobacteria bacterium]|nr:sulfite exporter TauE/SafE family protein [Alphaproteobacteria bacterium]